MKNTHLLVVDPQNDFCDIPDPLLPRVDGELLRAALPVPGSHLDMCMLSQFIDNPGTALSGITVTLDSHPYMAIERTTFWKDENGDEVAPFTLITDQDVASGRFQPASHRDLIMKQIYALGGNPMTVWPVHCVTGTWGHNIHSDVSSALNGWERRSGQPAAKVLKGEYPWSEHFGAFEAETPVRGVPSTHFNFGLAKRLTEDVDVLLVAGEASSHCVAASLDQLTGYMALLDKAPQIVLLTDCMSPVKGFEEAQTQLFERMTAVGARLCTTESIGDLWS